MPADIEVRNERSFFLLRPVSPEAKDWVETNVGGETTWWGGWLVVEPRYMAPLFAGLTEDGLTVGDAP